MSAILTVVFTVIALTLTIAPSGADRAGSLPAAALFALLAIGCGRVWYRRWKSRPRVPGPIVVRDYVHHCEWRDGCSTAIAENDAFCAEHRAAAAEWDAAMRCSVCDSPNLEPDPAGYYGHAEDARGAPYMCRDHSEKADSRLMSGIGFRYSA